jgi:phage-related minor tail protein
MIKSIGETSQHLHDYLVRLSKIPKKLKIFVENVQHPKWVEAIKQKMQAIKKNSTLILDDLPSIKKNQHQVDLQIEDQC